MEQFKDSIIKTADGVFFTKKNCIATINDNLIKVLERETYFTEKKRARVCFHSDQNSSTHVMLIALAKESVIKPHSHGKFDEFYHVLKGGLEIAIYNIKGEVQRSIDLSPDGITKPSFCKMPANIIHSVKSTGSIAIYLEVTEGPFNVSNTNYYTF